MVFHVHCTIKVKNNRLDCSFRRQGSGWLSCGDAPAPRWSFTTKLLLAASFTLPWTGAFCEIRAPSLNLRLLIQLELSVKVMLKREASPSRRLMIGSPVISGLWPSRFRTILEVNSSSLHSSPPSESKSPSRTTIKTFAEERGPLVTLMFVLGSISATVRGKLSSASILLPAKRVAGKSLMNLNSKLTLWELPTESTKDPDLHDSQPATKLSEQRTSAVVAGWYLAKRQELALMFLLFLITLERYAPTPLEPASYKTSKSTTVETR